MENITDTIAFSSDLSVIAKILEGEIALFEILVRRYNGVLYKIARSYGLNHQDAEDVMQDAHVSAFIALKDFAGRASYKTWISKILLHKCLYKLKYGPLKNEVQEANITELNYQPMFSKANEHQTEHTLLNRELAVILEKSLEKIPVMYRCVFVFREVEGFTVAETAELLNITPVNVKVRLNRAKSLLQQQIELFYSHNEVFSFNLIYCDAIVQKVFQKINDLRMSSNMP